MARAHVVVVEDEPAIRRGVGDALRLTGYAVTEAADGATGLREAAADGVDLVLLDLLLPRLDGLAVLAELRKRRPDRPVIVLTARGGEDDRVRGLTLGADDYVVKPFSARELLARVAAVLRRAAPPAAEVVTLTVGDAVIDLRRREVRWPGGERVELSETEAAVLTHLAANRYRPVSREELLGRVWGVGASGPETRAVDMSVVRLRSKLRTPDAVLTVRNAGYMAGPGLGVGGPS